MTYQIEPVGLEAAATIESIAQRTWPDTFGAILSEEQITYMLEMMYSSAALAEQHQAGHHFLLLSEGEEAVGYASYQLDYLPATTKIHKIYLLPKTQGKGYGKALILRVKEIAQAASQGRLRLDVNYQNPAIGFYEYLGFEKIGRHDTDIGNGYLMEDFIMEMPIG